MVSGNRNCPNISRSRQKSQLWSVGKNRNDIAPVVRRRRNGDPPLGGSGTNSDLLLGGSGTNRASYQ